MKGECPYCGHIGYAEFVDIGVGLEQVTPYHCHHCGADEINPWYDKPENWKGDMKLTGWYPPHD